MFESCSPVERLREYQRLSMWEKKVLNDWIGDRVGDMLLWSYTSLGLVEFFEDSEFGFVISHAQMQQAMLLKGHQPMDADAETWLFATGETLV